jgi:hypothetical protein
LEIQGSTWLTEAKEQLLEDGLLYRNHFAEEKKMCLAGRRTLHAGRGRYLKPTSISFTKIIELVFYSIIIVNAILIIFLRFQPGF